jgi:hypothetical protein
VSRRTIALLVAVLALRAAGVSAHTTSTGLARITIDGTAVVYRVTLVLSELPEAPRQLFSAAADGDQTAAELAVDELRRRVTIGDNAHQCRAGRGVIQGSRVADGRVTLELTLRCPSPLRRIVFTDNWPDLLGEHHRTLARIEHGGTVHEAALSPDTRRVTIDLAAAPRTSGFLLLGIEHVLTGYDHVLFLVALLLGGGRLLSMLKIITAFTVAHSVTLGLAVLGAVSIPDRLVETVIAASIVWVAIENVAFPAASSRRWLVALGFGLVHGFGFAGALSELDLPRAGLAVALLLFNVGVEVGQAVVVAAVVPILFWIRRRRWEPLVIRAGSALLVVLGLVWFVERLLA